MWILCQFGCHAAATLEQHGFLVNRRRRRLHAWFSVLLPEAGWLDVDPTNDQLVNSRYVVAAFGRDYRDVPPISGVIYTEGSSSTLTVKVDVSVV